MIFRGFKFLEARNIAFSYDIISNCEIALNDNIALPDFMLENFTLTKKIWHILQK